MKINFGICIYLLLILGMYLCMKPAITKIQIEKKADRNLMFTSGGRRSRKKKKEDKVYLHIEKLISTTTGKDEKLYIVIFLLISILFAVLGIVFISRVLPIHMSCFISIGLMCLPYIWLRVKLQNNRILASREGDILITVILNNYKICYYNMEEAIAKTAIEIQNAPYSKKILFNLAKGLNTAANNDDIIKLLDSFKYSLSTTWGSILSSNIYFACTSGIKVTNSLQDLSESIIKARRILEYTKRENNEAKLMLKYLAPISYLLTIVGSIKFFDFSFAMFMEYQFNTKTGLTWFFVVAFLYIVGILISTFLTKRKMEL
ncbi:MAG: hypothetical protein RR967_00700 [Anaerovoracaceae bacterium]